MSLFKTVELNELPWYKSSYGMPLGDWSVEAAHTGSIMVWFNTAPPASWGKWAGSGLNFIFHLLLGSEESLWSHFVFAVVIQWAWNVTWAWTVSCILQAGGKGLWIPTYPLVPVNRGRHLCGCVSEVFLFLWLSPWTKWAAVLWFDYLCCGSQQEMLGSAWSPSPPGLLCTRVRDADGHREPHIGNGKHGVSWFELGSWKPNNAL